MRYSQVTNGQTDKRITEGSNKLFRYRTLKLQRFLKQRLPLRKSKHKIITNKIVLKKFESVFNIIRRNVPTHLTQVWLIRIKPTNIPRPTPSLPQLTNKDKRGTNELNRGGLGTMVRSHARLALTFQYVCVWHRSCFYCASECYTTIRIVVLTQNNI